MENPLVQGFAELTAPCLRGENYGWFRLGLANQLLNRFSDRFGELDHLSRGTRRSGA